MTDLKAVEINAHYEEYAAELGESSPMVEALGMVARLQQEREEFEQRQKAEREAWEIEAREALAEFVKEHDEVTVKRLGEALGIATGTAHKHFGRYPGHRRRTYEERNGSRISTA